MQEIGVSEAKRKFGSLLDRVEIGEDIVITRHGRAVARLVACETDIDVACARAVGMQSRNSDWKACELDRDTGRS